MSPHRRANPVEAGAADRETEAVGLLQRPSYRNEGEGTLGRPEASGRRWEVGARKCVLKIVKGKRTRSKNYLKGGKTVKKGRLLLTVFTAAAFLFGTFGTAFGMEQESNGGAGYAAAQTQQDSVAEDVYRNTERHDFEVKNRTRNEGDELRIRVEQRLEQENAEEIGDGEFENGEFENGEFEDGEFTEPGVKGLEKRIAELEKKLAENPDDAKLLWKLAVAYHNAGEYDKAIEVLKDLEERLPHPTAKVAVLLAQCLKAKGDREAALAELEKLLELPETVSGAVYAYSGILKEELGKVEEAAEDVEKAITAEPKEKDLYKKVGELYRKAGREGVKVFVKGKKLALDAEPFIEDGRTMMPVRAIAEALGLEVDYRDGVITLANPASGKTVVLYVGRAEAEVDGRKVALDVPAKVVPPGRTVVPLRFVSENLGAAVDWFEDGQVVAITEQ
ncbi:tetratricopeptide repeat protein [Moorellaceae bacterium AZ2]